MYLTLPRSGPEHSPGLPLPGILRQTPPPTAGSSHSHDGRGGGVEGAGRRAAAGGEGASWGGAWRRRRRTRARTQRCRARAAPVGDASAPAATSAPALRCARPPGPAAERSPRVAVRPPGAFPEPPVMGAARGARSSPRRLPLFSVLLLPLLGGESRRAGGAGSGAREPRWYKGAPRRAFGRLERGRHPGEAGWVRSPGGWEVAKP